MLLAQHKTELRESTVRYISEDGREHERPRQDLIAPSVSFGKKITEKGWLYEFTVTNRKAAKQAVKQVAFWYSQADNDVTFENLTIPDGWWGIHNAWHTTGQGIRPGESQRFSVEVSRQLLQVHLRLTALDLQEEIDRQEALRPAKLSQDFTDYMVSQNDRQDWIDVFPEVTTTK